jgi:predicted secreted protein with PEFG-CTERM motif
MNILFYLVSIMVVFSFTNIVFAATYDINMPSGSASPDSPYFWQNEKSGLATGDIEILVGDTVIWKNADRAKHTITSGTVDGGPDGIFGSSAFLVPGQSYPYKFDKIGQYPYYCLIHPWMTGTVFVTDGYKIIPQIGKNIGDGSKFFDVPYQFDRILSLTMIDEMQKLLTFEIIGNSQSDASILKIRLPVELIDGPFVIIIDGQKISDFEHFVDKDINNISISVPTNSKLITIIGTSIIPEFGALSVIVLGVGTLSVMTLSKKLRFR